MTRKIAPFLVILITSSILVACAGISQTPVEPTAAGIHEIDPTFRRFYTYYGGLEVFGLAISDARFENDVLIQYTESAAMIYDPQALATQRFRLAPLGAQLVIPEPEVPQPTAEGYIYVDGHIIHPIFVATYEKLKDILGKPLGEARRNSEYDSIVQLFENMGLSYDLRTDKVGFLAFGIAMCDSRCRKVYPDYSIAFGFFPVDPTFSTIVTNLGIDFTGYPITPAFNTSDGRWQQIFEKIVISAQAPNNTDTLAIEPIAKKLPFIADPPQVYSGNPALQFFPTQGDLGYEIPDYFWEYFMKHGGEAILGAPISQVRKMSDSIFVQCFHNQCLEYDLNAVESNSVSPVSLGYPFKTIYGPHEPGYEPSGVLSSPTPIPTLTATPQQRTITLQVWDSLRALDTRLQQEIGVSININHLPASGIQPFLILNLPDGSQKMEQFPPTNVDGRSVLRLPLIEGKNGDFVIYVVCVNSQCGELFCVEDSFLIWNNP